MSKDTDWLAKTGDLATFQDAGPLEDSFDLNRYEVTCDPLEVEDHKAPPELDKQLPDLTEAALNDPASLLPRVQELLERFPDEPHLLNKLVAGLMASGENERAEEVARRNFEKNPTYLFARLNYAEFLLNRGDPDPVLPALGGTFNLRKMYPHRTVFHVTEVVALLAVMMRYFFAKGNDEVSLRCAKTLLKLDPDSPLAEVAKDVEQLIGLRTSLKRALSNFRQHSKKLGRTGSSRKKPR